jgi:hypothetical protein
MGALFKLEHWQGADIMLCAGLITEAIIFFFYAFDTDEEPAAEPAVQAVGALPLSTRLGEPYTQAAATRAALEYCPYSRLNFNDEEEEYFEDLPSGKPQLLQSFRGVSTFPATTERNQTSFAQSSGIKRYKNVPLSGESMEQMDGESQAYMEQMHSLNKNILALNSFYKNQLNGADAFLNDMEECAIETRRYKDQIRDLNGKLAIMNRHYGKVVSNLEGH